MKRKLDEYTAEARPFFKRFKSNPIDNIQDVLNLHFFVEPHANEEALKEELEPLSVLDQALLYGSEKEFRGALGSMQDLNQLIGDEDNESVPETVLMIAISRGFTDIAKQLLPKVDLTIETPEWQHALHYACEYDNDEVALTILDIMKDDKDYLNALDKDNMTPLFYAAMNGNEIICRRLLELKAKQQFFTSHYEGEDTYGKDHLSNIEFSARYFAADSLDVDTFRLFVNHDVTREYGDDAKDDITDEENYMKYLMACTLIEPYLVMYMNRLNGYKPYTINIANVTMYGLKGDESGDPSVDEGGQLESASQCFELIDLCKQFFPDRLEYQFYVWKYAIGSEPEPIHAIIMGDLDMLKYLVKQNNYYRIWRDYDDGAVVAQSVLSFATSNNDIDLVKYVCEDMGLVKLLGEDFTFIIPPDVTGQVRKYLKSLGAVSEELPEDKMQAVEYFATDDPSLVLYDFTRCVTANEDPEINIEPMTIEESDQEGPIVRVENEILIEILTNINAPDNEALAKVCKKFRKVLELPEFWRVSHI